MKNLSITILLTFFCGCYEISNTLNITDEVIRYLLVKTDEKERSKIAAARAKNNDDKQEEE